MKNRLAQVVEYTLSQKPARVGLRLRGENELAALFGVSRMRLRRSLDQLVERGILVRYHGSGTYLRRIPLAPEKPRETPPFSIEDLLAEIDNDGNRQLPDPDQSRLQLGLYSDLHAVSQSSAHRALLEGMKSRCTESGHTLTVGSVVERENVPREAGDIAAALELNPCDGYLTVSRWRHLFQEAYATVCGQTGPPVVFIWPASQPVDCQPLVQTDTDEAVARGVRILAQEGYQRIGLLSFVFPCHPAKQEQLVYERAMEDAGLDYAGSVSSDLKRHATLQALDKLLERDDPIDALYVANDEALPCVAEHLASHNLVPGRDIGLITLANTASRLPSGHNWSRLQFDPAYVGRSAVDSLALAIQSAGETILSMSHQAAWIEGDTHRKPA